MPNKKPDVDKIFHALGDPTRRAMLQQLSHGPVAVSNIATPLGITLAAAVQHLKILEDSKLIRTKKVGRTRTCQLEPAGLSAAERWIQHCRSLWERRMDRLAQLV